MHSQHDGVQRAMETRRFEKGQRVAKDTTVVGFVAGPKEKEVRMEKERKEKTHTRERARKAKARQVKEKVEKERTTGERKPTRWKNVSLVTGNACPCLPRVGVVEEVDQGTAQETTQNTRRHTGRAQGPREDGN